ncbi:hypothetical protein ACHAWT_008118 [Skeletonema menzelii]
MCALRSSCFKSQALKKKSRPQLCAAHELMPLKQRMKPKIPKNKRKNNSPASAADDENNNRSITIRDDSSRYIGVTFRSRRKKYQARMYRGSHEYNLGLFDLAADAALAYDAAHRVTGGRGISSSTVPSSPPSTTSKGGHARGSIPDAEEIKYALDWIDCADENERPSGLPEDDPVHLNFLRPSDFRQAREKEISRHRDKNKCSNNSDEELVFPTESDLKLRIKQEILNIAKTYVSQQAKTPGPPDEGSDLTSSNDDEEELIQPGDGNGGEVVLKGGSRPAKKRKLQHMSLSARYEDCHEEARTLLSLNKRSSKESKQAARAQKLLEFMAGGEAAVDSNNGQVSVRNQADGEKENPRGKDDKKKSSSDADNMERQLQQNLARQQALTIDSFRGSFNQSALMSSLLGQYSLEQVLRFARERPDLVNEEKIQEFVRAQKSDMSLQLGCNENQKDLLYSQLQMAMMTGGHFNPTQISQAAESLQSRSNACDGHAKKINLGGAKDGVDTRTQQDGKSTFGPPVGREARASDESPFLMKALEEYRQQGGNQDQAALQKKIANEAKRAALAQKLSIHLSNESEASIATKERSKIYEKKKSEEPPPVGGDSKEKATVAPAGKKEGEDTESKDKKAPSSSKVDCVGGGDWSGEFKPPNGSADASRQVKPKGQPNAFPPHSIAGYVPVAGLQQGLPSVQAMDPFQQAILHHAMVNRNAQQHQHLAQAYGGGNSSEMPASEVALRLQHRLVNEEYRLQQLRQTLQTQALLPYLNVGGFGVTGANNLLNHMGNNVFAGGLANSLMQQSMNNNNQDLLLQQALALQSHQNASMNGALQSPSNEQMFLAAQRQGIDAGTLAQLLMIRGGTSQPPPSSKKD